MLLEEGLLTPEIVDRFFIEWVTELDFTKLDQKDFHEMEEFLKIVT